MVGESDAENVVFAGISCALRGCICRMWYFGRMFSGENNVENVAFTT